ncbi:hypothetical protein FB45DRAFT_911882, partial [Roridomyces roridus]
MSALAQLKYGSRLSRFATARIGQLVYSKEQPNITACFYEYLGARGISLTSEESDCLFSFETNPLKLGRPCIILGRTPDGGYNVCFLAQIRAQEFSPIGRFFGVPLGTSSASLRLTPPTQPTLLHKPRFYLFAIPVIRHRIHLPPGEPRHLVPEDVQRAIEFVRDRENACYHTHATLRREQMQWVRDNRYWRFKNPQEGGVNLRTYLKM